MQPAFEKVNTGLNQSFYVNHLKTDQFPSPLHFHPEIEILLIIEGTGTRLIGDSVGRFSPGELIMIGSKIPHVWHSDKPVNSKDDSKKPETIYIQFKEDFAGGKFNSLPEFQTIKKLFEDSKRGIKLTGDTREKLSKMVKNIYNADGFKRIVILMDMLQTIAESKETELLASPVVNAPVNEKDSTQLNKIYNYILENYNENILVDQIAFEANLSTSAFCRYFKKNTNKTFIQFLNEVRVGHACRFLQSDKNQSVSQICYACGYNNTSYFIRQFKRITGYTPLSYRKRFLGEYV